MKKKKKKKKKKRRRKKKLMEECIGNNEGEEPLERSWRRLGVVGESRQIHSVFWICFTKKPTLTITN